MKGDKSGTLRVTILPPESTHESFQEPESPPKAPLGLDDPHPSEEKARRRRGPKTQIPTNWQPGETLIGFALDLGFAWEEINWQAEQFRDHVLAEDRHYCDWDAAFRKWLRRATELPRGGANGAARKMSFGETAMLVAARMSNERLGLDGTSGHTGDNGFGPSNWQRQ